MLVNFMCLYLEQPVSYFFVSPTAHFLCTLTLQFEKNKTLFLCPSARSVLCPFGVHLIVLVAVHPYNRHYPVKLSQCGFPMNNRDSLATMRQPIMTITTARATPEDYGGLLPLICSKTGRAGSYQDEVYFIFLCFFLLIFLLTYSNC